MPFLLPPFVTVSLSPSRFPLALLLRPLTCLLLLTPDACKALPENTRKKFPEKNKNEKKIRKTINPLLQVVSQKLDLKAHPSAG